MTRVRKVAAVSLMTPMAAAALAVGVNQQPADAAGCPPIASATITAPAGTPTSGSSVHVSAKISGLMLLQAHLQISGPGLDKQVGNSVMSGEIKGDVVVPKPGYFTLAVVGNGTKCTYQTAGFSVKAKASAVKPSHSSAPSHAPRSGGSNGAGSAANAPSLPTGSAGNGAGANFGLNPLNGASPFSLPSVAPDGSAQGFQYPSPDPQVASPPSRPEARNVSEITPIKWGQSLAIALVLLVISAHLGMWSRRQRLAAEGARTAEGGKPGRRKSRKAAAMVAEASVLTDSPTARPTDAATAAPVTDVPATGATADHTPAADGTLDASGATPASSVTRASSATPASGAKDDDSDEADSKRSSGRGYHGRRRRS